MPLGFCTWVFIVRLSDDQWLSRDENAPTSRVHRLMKLIEEIMFFLKANCLNLNKFEKVLTCNNKLNISFGVTFTL